MKSSPDLTHVSVFTPSDHQQLDANDTDFGSGGVLVLPSRVGSRTLAAAAGKDGRMFLLDRSNLGVVDTVNIGACWCGQSYFNDGSPHIVSSGGANVHLWSLQTSPQTTMVDEGSSPSLLSPSQPTGFFTTISSQRSANVIIWAVSRPSINFELPLLWLYTFKAVPDATGNLPMLFHAVAGIWSPSAFAGANSSSVPVVANGKVYVASYKELAIFGLNLPGGQKEHERMLPKESGSEEGPEQHEVYGILVSAEGGRLKIRDRAEKIIEVDATVAILEYHSIPLTVGRAVHLGGTYDSAGVLHAATIQRARMSAAAWPGDR